MESFEILLKGAAKAHGHICPGQVIRDKKEVMRNNDILCRSCALGSYYYPVKQKGKNNV